MSSPFHENLRYEYDLTPDSVVIDGGGFEGCWSEEISKKYGCNIHVFEPVPRFRDQCVERLAQFQKVHVHQYGIGGRTEFVPFMLANNSTGAYANGEKIIEVSLQPMNAIFAKYGIGAAELVKLNIEGLEFDVMENVIETGLVGRVTNWQIQWHPVATDALRRFPLIQKALAKTHELVLDSGWTWQGWRLRK